MTALPISWTSVRLGVAITLNYGKALPEHSRTGAGFPVYGSNGVVGRHTQPLTSGPTIIIGRKGSVGAVQFSSIPCSPIDTTYFITQTPGGQLRYWYYLLSSLELSSLNKSTAIPGLSREDAYRIEVSIAPLNEQKRIADKLDTVLTRVDAVNDRLARVAPLLKRFRQSVLAAATSGRLTEDWRLSVTSQNAADDLQRNLELRVKSEKKAPAPPDMTHWKKVIPPTWAVASVHQFAECLDRLRVPIKRDARKSELRLYPYYGANGEVGRIDEYIFDSELVLVTEDETFYGREKPIAYRSSGKCWVNNHAHVLRAPSKEASDYLCYSLMYYDVIPWLSGTTGRAKLTQQALNSLPIAVPPSQEITEIVRRVETLFAFADRLETRLQAARTAANRLTPALLAKAFRGELVPQDPNDEQAAELLKRLASNVPTSPKRRGRPAKAA